MGKGLTADREKRTAGQSSPADLKRGKKVIIQRFCFYQYEPFNRIRPDPHLKTHLILLVAVPGKPLININRLLKILARPEPISP